MPLLRTGATRVSFQVSGNTPVSMERLKPYKTNFHFGSNESCHPPRALCPRVNRFQLGSYGRTVPSCAVPCRAVPDRTAPHRTAPHPSIYLIRHGTAQHINSPNCKHQFTIKDNSHLNISNFSHYGFTLIFPIFFQYCR